MTTALHTTQPYAPRRCAQRSGAFALVAAMLALLATLLGPARPASAHAELLSTAPRADEVVPTSPPQIVLTFTEVINIVDDSIRLVDGSGTDISLTDIGQANGSASATATVPALPNGSYVVAWHVVSADSHPISGAFAFSVGAASTTDPGLLGSLSSEPPDTAGEVWLGIGRATSFGGIALLLGGSLALAACALGLGHTRRARRLVLIGGLIGLVGTAMMIVAQAHVTLGEASRWADVYGTRAGRWWFVRLGYLAVLLMAAAVLVRRSTVARLAGWVVGPVAGLGLLAVVAAGGHGVTGRHAGLGFAATVAHLAAMCAWVGGVAVMALVAPRDRLWKVAHRFSPMALASVAMLAGTGVVNAWRQSDSWDALVDSTYGRWLLVKVVVITFIVSVAAANRWLLQTEAAAVASPPTAAVGAAVLDDVDGSSAPAGAGDLPDAGRVLRRTVLLEAGALVLVFAATAGLVNSPPARSATAAVESTATTPAIAAAPPAAVSGTVIQGDRTAVITLDPPVTGGTLLDVTLTNSVTPTEVPTAITVSVSNLLQNLGPLDIPVTIVGDGHATATDADFPFAGTWTILVSVRYGEFEDVSFATRIDVS